MAESLLFGLAALASYYPVYLLNKKTTDEIEDPNELKGNIYKHRNNENTRINNNSINAIFDRDNSEGIYIPDNIDNEQIIILYPGDDHGKNDSPTGMNIDSLQNLYADLNTINNTLSKFKGTPQTILDSNLSSNLLNTLDDAADLINANDSTSIYTINCKKIINNIRYAINNELNYLTEFFDKLSINISSLSNQALPPSTVYDVYNSVIFEKTKYYEYVFKIYPNILIDSTNTKQGYSPYNLLSQYEAVLTSLEKITTELRKKYNDHITFIKTYITSEVILKKINLLPEKIVCVPSSTINIIIDLDEDGEKLLYYSDNLELFNNETTNEYLFSTSEQKSETIKLLNITGSRLRKDTKLYNYLTADNNAIDLEIANNDIISIINDKCIYDRDTTNSYINASLFDLLYDKNRLINAVKVLQKFSTPNTCYLILNSKNDLFPLFINNFNKFQTIMYEELTNVIYAINTTKLTLPYDPIENIQTLITVKNTQDKYVFYRTLYKDSEIISSSFIHTKTKIRSNNVTLFNDLSYYFTSSDTLVHIQNYYKNWIKQTFICKTSMFNNMLNITIGDIIYNSHWINDDYSIPITREQYTRLDDIKKILTRFISPPVTHPDYKVGVILSDSSIFYITNLLIDKNTQNLAKAIIDYIDSLNAKEQNMNNDVILIQNAYNVVSTIFKNLFSSTPKTMDKQELINVYSIKEYLSEYHFINDINKKRFLNRNVQVSNVNIKTVNDIMKYLREVVFTGPNQIFELNINVITDVINKVRNEMLTLYNPLTQNTDVAITNDQFNNIKQQIDMLTKSVLPLKETEYSHVYYNVASEFDPDEALTNEYAVDTKKINTLPLMDFYLAIKQINNMYKIYRELEPFIWPTEDYEEYSILNVPEGNILYYNLTKYPLDTVYSGTSQICKCNYPSCKVCNETSTDALCKSINCKSNMYCSKNLIDKCSLIGFKNYYKTLTEYLNYVNGNSDNIVITFVNTTGLLYLPNYVTALCTTLLNDNNINLSLGVRTVKIPGLVTFFKQIPPLNLSEQAELNLELMDLMNHISGFNRSSYEFKLILHRINRISKIITVNNKLNSTMITDQSWKLTDTISHFNNITDNKMDKENNNKLINRKEHAVLSCSGLEPIDCNQLNNILNDVNNFTLNINKLYGNYTDPWYINIDGYVDSIIPIYNKVFNGVVLIQNDINIIKEVKNIISDDEFITAKPTFNPDVLKLYNYLVNMIDYIESHPLLKNVYSIRIEQTIYNKSMNISGIRLYGENNMIIDMNNCVFKTNDETMDISLAKNIIVTNNEFENYSSSKYVKTLDRKGTYIEIKLPDINCQNLIMTGNYLFRIVLNFYNGIDSDIETDLSGINIFTINCKNILLSATPVIPIFNKSLSTWNTEYDFKLYNNKEILHVTINDYTAIIGTVEYVICRHIILQRKEDYMTRYPQIILDSIVIMGTDKKIKVPKQILAYPVGTDKFGQNTFGIYAMTDELGENLYDGKYASTAIPATGTNGISYIHIDLGEDISIASITLNKPLDVLSDLSAISVKTVTSFFMLTCDTSTPNDLHNVVNTSHTVYLTGESTLSIFNPYLIDTFQYNSCIPDCIQESTQMNTYIGYNYDMKIGTCFQPKLECDSRICLSGQYINNHNSCSKDKNIDTRINKVRYVVIHQLFNVASPISIVKVLFYADVSTTIINDKIISCMMYPTSSTQFADTTLIPNNVTPVTTESGFVKKYFKYDFGEDVDLLHVNIYFNKNINQSNPYIIFIQNDNTVISNTECIISANAEYTSIYTDVIGSITPFSFNDIEFSTAPTGTNNINVINANRQIKKLEFNYPDCTNSLSSSYCLNREGKNLIGVNYRINNDRLGCYVPKNNCDNCLENISEALYNEELTTCNMTENYPLCAYARFEIPIGYPGSIHMYKFTVKTIDNITSDSHFDYYTIYPIDTTDPSVTIAGNIGNLSTELKANTNNDSKQVRFIQGSFNFVEKRIYQITIIFSINDDLNTTHGNLYIIDKFGVATYAKLIDLQKDTINGTLIVDTIVNNSTNVDYSYPVKKLDSRYYPNKIALPGAKYLFDNDICFTPNAKCIDCISASGNIATGMSGLFDSCATYFDSKIMPRTCKLNVENAQNLSICMTGLEGCSGAYNICATGLTTCKTDLSNCSGAYNICATGLNTCKSDLSKCSSSLDPLKNDVNRCNNSLNTCSTTLNTCNTDLAYYKTITLPKLLDMNKQIISYNDISNINNNKFILSTAGPTIADLVGKSNDQEFYVINITNLSLLVKENASTNIKLNQFINNGCPTTNTSYQIYNEICNIPKISKNTYLNNIKDYMIFNCASYQGYLFSKIEIGAWNFISTDDHKLYDSEIGSDVIMQGTVTTCPNAYIDNINLIYKNNINGNYTAGRLYDWGYDSRNVDISFVTQIFVPEIYHPATYHTVVRQVVTEVASGRPPYVSEEAYATYLSVKMKLEAPDELLPSIVISPAEYTIYLEVEDQVKNRVDYITRPGNILPDYNTDKDGKGILVTELVNKAYTEPGKYGEPENERYEQFINGAGTDEQGKYAYVSSKESEDPLSSFGSTMSTSGWNNAVNAVRSDINTTKGVYYRKWYSCSPYNNYKIEAPDIWRELVNYQNNTILYHNYIGQAMNYKAPVNDYIYDPDEPRRYDTVLLRIRPISCTEQDTTIVGITFRLSPGAFVLKPSAYDRYKTMQLFIKCYLADCPNFHGDYIYKTIDIDGRHINPDGTNGRYYAIMFN